jgi:hypothetical protein
MKHPNNLLKLLPENQSAFLHDVQFPLFGAIYL